MSNNWQRIIIGWGNALYCRLCCSEWVKTERIWENFYSESVAMLLWNWSWWHNNITLTSLVHYCSTVIVLSIIFLGTMSGNCQNNLRWMNGCINDEYSLHQSYSENNSDPDRDDSKQGSAQSSEGKPSTQGDTNDDTTSDDCKPPAT